MADQRLPIVDSDDGIWGDIIRQFLMKEHYNTDTNNAANGGHQKVTIRPGTSAAGTAPLKFSSGPLLSTPEAGAVEFLTDSLYFTQSTSTIRKRIAAYDDTGATGDIYYRASTGNLTRLAPGSTGDILTIASGVPSWTASIVGKTINLASNTLTGTTAQFNAALSDGVFVTQAATQTLTGKTISGSNNTITNLNASSITAGALPMARIGIGDFENLAAGSDFETDNYPWSTASNRTVVSEYSHSGTYSYKFSTGAGNASYIGGTIELKEGEQLYVECWVRRDADYNATDARIRLGAMPGNLNVANLYFRASDISEIDTWVKRSFITNPYPVGTIGVAPSITMTGLTAGNLWIDDIVIRRVKGAELIPDLDTGKLTSGTLPVARGGTGAATLTGIVRGNGTGAFTAVTAPSGALVGTTDTQILSGKTISGANNTLTAIALASLNTSGTASGSTYLRGDGTWATPSSGGDASTNTATSVDGEVALFSGTTGKTLKRATGTGLAKLTSGVLSVATAGTDYSTSSASETLANKTISGSSNTITNIDATTALDATGTKSSATFLRGDNTWATPTNTTYSEITSAEITTGTASTGRLISGRRAQEIVDKAVAASGDVTLNGVQTLTNKTIVLPQLNSISVNNSSLSDANFSMNSDSGRFPAFNPVSKYLWHDNLSFTRWTGIPTYETFSSGVWTTQTLDKSPFNGKESQTTTLANGTTVTAVRWTWNHANFSNGGIQWWVIGFPYVSSTAPVNNIVVESSSDGTTWVSRHNSTTNSNAYPVWLYTESTGSHTYMRLTITNTNSQTIRVSTIRALTSRWSNQGGGSEYEYPYDWDNDGNMTIGAMAVARSNGALNLGGTAPTTAAEGIFFGTDTNMYRSAANTLRTDDNLIVGTAGTTAGSVATIDGTQTLSGKTLTAPRFANGGFIADANGAEQLSFTSVASAVNDIGITNAVAGSAPQVSARGNDTNINLNLVSKGTGRVQANGVNIATATDLAGKADMAHTHTASQISDSTTTGRSVLTASNAAAARSAIGAGTGDGDVTLSGAQILSNKTISGSNNTFSNIPQSAITGLETDFTKLVSSTANGNTATENGANTWAKILTYSTGTQTYRDMSLLLAVSSANGSGDTAIVSLFLRSNNTDQNPTVDVRILSKGGASAHLVDDSFKVISDGWSTDMELWVKKGSTYGGYNIYEVSKRLSGGTLTYNATPAWQSAVPTGTVHNVSSNGVYSGLSLTANGTVTGTRFISSVATGTAPLTVSSTTAVTNLNADLLDGNHASAFALTSHTHTAANISDSTTVGRSVLTAASAAAARTAIGAGVGDVTLSGAQALANKTLTDPVINGTVSGTGVATTTTANTLALRDANGNLSANALLPGFTTTATSGITTTMTIASDQIQVFTGSAAQTVRLPSTSVAAGGQYRIINNSTGLVTVQSSVGNAIIILASNTSALFTALQAAPTSNTHWDSQYFGSVIATGKTLTTTQSLTLSGTDNTTMTFPNASGTVVTTAAAQALTNKDLTGTGNSFSATNLTTGTVPDARMTGTYSGFTHKVDGANSVFSTASSGSSNTLARTVYGLAEYRSSSATTTGAIVFFAPTSGQSIMMQLELSGLLYQQNVVDMVVQGYRSSTTSWNDARKVSRGSVDVDVRWAMSPSGNNCLIIGDVDTVWNYPHFSITRAMFSHSSVTDAFCVGWTVGLVTDLSTYTNVSSVISNMATAGNISGSAATLTTARTIQTNLASTSSASFNGSANITPGVTGTLGVANGGTGRTTSTTAYGIIAAGTSTTGAQQTIAPGTAGQFLKSAGASAYASFASIDSTDISDSTTTGRSVLTAASASAARTAIGAGTGNGDVTLAGTQTLTNKTISGSSNTFTNIGVASMDATGTPGTTTYLRGDGTWTTPPNNTYSEITSAEITTGTATTARAISGRRAQEIVNKAVAASGDVTLTGTQTLTNKTISLANNTITGTTAQFNAALSDNLFATQAGTETLTNKRITPRITSITSSATPTINVTTTDQYNITALATNITSLSVTGTALDGQRLMVRIASSAVRTITWSSSFKSSGIATLLTGTSANRTHLIGFIYDAVDAKWVCTAVDAAGY